MQALLSKYKNAPKRDRSRDGGGNRARGRSDGSSRPRYRDRPAQLAKPELCVYLVHIPKTAGTAIKHVLTQTERLNQPPKVKFVKDELGRAPLASRAGGNFFLGTYGFPEPPQRP